MADLTGSDDIGGVNQSAENSFDGSGFWFEWIEFDGNPNNLTQAGFNIADGSLGAGQTVYNAGSTDDLDGLVSNASAAILGDSGQRFGVRVTTTIEITNAGEYTFDVRSDDGVRFYVDGAQVVVDDSVHSPRTRSGDIDLTAGRHEITIIYFERTGRNVLEVDIQGPDYPTEIPLQDAAVSANAGDDTVTAGEGDDSVDGGLGDDQLFGGADDDTLRGGEGADTIFGGDGADAVFGDDGDDQLFGGEGDDLIEGGAGEDSLFGGDGDDFLRDFSGSTSVDGGAGEDTINIFGGATQNTVFGGADDDAILIFNAASGSNTVDGGGGDDVIQTGDSADSIAGGDGADQIDAGAGDDIVDGGAGDDTLQGAAGSDTVTGGDGADQINDFDGANDIDGGAGADTIFVTAGNFDNTVSGGAGDDEITVFNAAAATNEVDGGAGDDVIQTGDSADVVAGGEGDDVIIAGNGADTLSGGEGDDTIDAGEGDDQILGDDGFDVFVVTGGADTIGDFNFATGQDIDDGLQDNNDFLDLAPYYDTIFETRDDLADDGLLNQSNAGNVVKGAVVDYGDDTALPGAIQLDGVAPEALTFDNVNVVCFTAGVRILTPEGERAIEALKVGDLVTTMDRGDQPVRWIGGRRVPARGALAPVRMTAGALPGLTRDLTVSQQHRMLLTGWRAQLHFGAEQVLAAAKHLVNGDTIYVDERAEEVEYVHILFDRHEIVFAEGAPAESLHPGQTALDAIEEEARAELLTIFPELTTGDAAHARTARRCLRGFEARIFRFGT